MAIRCGFASQNLFSILELLHSSECDPNELIIRLQKLLNFSAAIIYLDPCEPQLDHQNDPAFNIETSYGLDDQSIKMFRNIDRAKFCKTVSSVEKKCSDNKRSIHQCKELTDHNEYLPRQLSVQGNEIGISSRYRHQAAAHATQVHLFFSKSSPVTDTHVSTVSKLMPHINQLLLMHLSSRIKQHYNYLLTRREREVFNWVKAGKSAHETAFIIGVSERTIKFHLRNIYLKLNVTSKTQAIVKGFEVGIFEHSFTNFYNQPSLYN